MKWVPLVDLNDPDKAKCFSCGSADIFIYYVNGREREKSNDNG